MPGASETGVYTRLLTPVMGAVVTTVAFCALVIACLLDAGRRTGAFSMRCPMIVTGAVAAFRNGSW